jgi:endonuclease/exonuclease/phosphatase (EEP) superfamily protein YafD
MRKALLFSSWLLFLAGCSSQPTMTESWGPLDSSASIACSARLANSSKVAASVLNANGFSLVNWNIQKGGNPAWVYDLRSLDSDPDLLILQEAVAGTPASVGQVSDYFHSFAEGFSVGEWETGVMTTSTAEPLTECRLEAIEPWLGTRKATLVTEYALTDSDETLLVVNIHGINFTLGLSALQEQLRQVHAIIEQHTGPVLVAGDFNTWSGRRAAMLQRLVDNLDLVALEYDVDHRTRFFGQILDHIYVRGLETVHASTLEVGSSDHNPMIAELRLEQKPERQRVR